MNKSRQHILVIEDELPIIQALQDKFTRAGFEVSSAKNGKDGLEIALKEQPDLILLDLVLPKMDGMTMLKKLRDDEWGKDVPVIILTNLSDMKKVDEAAKDYVFDYLIKADWKIEEVVERVKERLDDR